MEPDTTSTIMQMLPLLLLGIPFAIGNGGTVIWLLN
jgi:hypothetical protein